MAYFPFQPGQQPMSSSQGVVIASDQSAVSVTGTVLVAGNHSVSGTVGASVIGLTPVAVTNTPSVSGLLGASIIAVGIVNQADGATSQQQLMVDSRTRVYNGSNWDRLRGDSSIGALVSTGGSSVITLGQGSVAVAIISGSIAATFTPPANQSVSGTVTVIQGSTWIASVFGNMSVIGTVPVTQSGAWNVNATLVAPSIVGTYAEDSAHATASNGLFTLGVRNDAVASFTSANLDYGPITTDSAGRTITKPFSAEESRIEGYHSVVSQSVTTLVATAGTGLKNYVTDFFIVNTGNNTALITFQDGLGSILGYTIAPAGGGSNSPGIATPFRTGANTTFDFKATPASSVIYATVKGFKAP